MAYRTRFRTRSSSHAVPWILLSNLRDGSRTRRTAIRLVLAGIVMACSILCQSCVPVMESVLWVKRPGMQPLKPRRSRPVKPLFELFYACDVLQPLAIEQVIRPESATVLAQYKRPRTRL